MDPKNEPTQTPPTDENTQPPVGQQDTPASGQEVLVSHDALMGADVTAQDTSALQQTPDMSIEDSPSESDATTGTDADSTALTGGEDVTATPPVDNTNPSGLPETQLDTPDATIPSASQDDMSTGLAPEPASDATAMPMQDQLASKQPMGMSTDAPDTAAQIDTAAMQQAQNNMPEQPVVPDTQPTNPEMGMPTAPNSTLPTEHKSNTALFAIIAVVAVVVVAVVVLAVVML